RDVVRDRELQCQPFSLAVFAQVAEAAADLPEAPEARSGEIAPAQSDRAGGGTREAEEAAEQLAPPRADQSGDPQDLAGAQLEARRLQQGRRGEIAHLEEELAPGCRRAGRSLVDALDLPADHPRDQLP